MKSIKKLFSRDDYIQNDGVDIFIIGAGVFTHKHLTLEACSVIRSVNIIFFSRYNERVRTFIADINPRATLIDLDQNRYSIGDYRPVIYEEMAGDVVNAAKKVGKVALLEPGSAIVTDQVTQNILRLSNKEQFTVKMIPGISSVELVLIELGFDLSIGIQIFQAQQLLLYKQTLNPNISAIILQPGYYDTLWWGGFPYSLSRRYDTFYKMLCESYSLEAPMALFFYPISGNKNTNVFWFRLKNFRLLRCFISPFHTMFIPSTTEIQINSRFGERIESWSSFLKNVKTDSSGKVKQIHSLNNIEGNYGYIPQELKEESKMIQTSWDNRQL